VPGIKPLGHVALHVVPTLGRREALPPSHVVLWRGDSLNAATTYILIIIIINVVILVLAVVVVLPLLLLSRVNLVRIVTGLCVGRPRNSGSILCREALDFYLPNYVGCVIETNV